MPRFFRICRKVYQPWDPGGALRVPGRWHDLGQPVLYFSSSLALAVLEAKANGAEFDVLRKAYHFAFTDSEREFKDLEMIPDTFFRDGWAHAPHTTRQFGSRWFQERRSLLLGVRSAVLSVEHNYIINAAHPDFGRLRCSEPGSIPLDPRI